jgi:hypothetical protein
MNIKLSLNLEHRSYRRSKDIVYYQPKLSKALWVHENTKLIDLKLCIV